MSDHFDRQISAMRRLIDDYRSGRITLDALIQRIEAVSSAIDLGSWKEAIFPIILAMEQVNASVINEKRNLDAANKAVIEKSLNDLETWNRSFSVVGLVESNNDVGRHSHAGLHRLNPPPSSSTSRARSTYRETATPGASL